MQRCPLCESETDFEKLEIIRSTDGSRSKPAWLCRQCRTSSGYQSRIREKFFGLDEPMVEIGYFSVPADQIPAGWTPRRND